MTGKFIAFDIETAKILPDFVDDLMTHRPLGISCAAARAEDELMAQLFHSVDADGRPASQMSQDDLARLVDYLLEKTEAGYTVVTHNGLGFDFDILAEESGRLEDCKKLAVGHVDMMFQVFCVKGFAVGLDAAAKSMGLSKMEGVDGSLAPQMWKDGQYQQVLDYVAQDCDVTMKIARACDRNRAFRWLTKRGKISDFAMPNGWLSVKAALELPLPDTSWMDDPWPRSKFTGWLS